MKTCTVAILAASLVLSPAFAKNHGGVNLNAQCARQAPGSRAVIVDEANKVTKQNSAPKRAYNWRCQLRDGSLQSMNLNAACAAQHGSTAKAEVSNANDAYSWQCVSPDPVAPAIAAGTLIDYKNYKGQTEKLFAYPGKRAVVLVPTAVFADMSVRGWPRNSLPQFPGKSSVAIVKATCGAGCGAGGRAEIQIQEFTAAQKLMGSVTNALTWQVGHYELGRGGSSHKNPGFVFFPALDPSAGHDVVASAFPEFAMSVCVDRLDVTPAAYEQSNKTVGYPRGPGVVEFGRRFRATKFTFTEAYEKDRNGFYRGWALSSLLFDLYLKFGFDRMKVFMANLAAIASESGQVKSHVAVSKNLLEAARRTGGEAMVSYLRDSWRVLE